MRMKVNNFMMIISIFTTKINFHRRNIIILSNGIMGY